MRKIIKHFRYLYLDNHNRIRVDNTWEWIGQGVICECPWCKKRRDKRLAVLQKRLLGN